MPFDEALDAFFDDDLDLDPTDAGEMIDLLEDAAHFNLESKQRRGSTVHLKSGTRLLMTGDLHDHRPNYGRILKLAKLDESPDNHLILHEVVHGNNIVDGRDMSILMLAHVAALKIKYPEQVHLLLSNHELAQVNGETALKKKVDQCEQFNDALEFLYDDDADDVRDAMTTYVRSLLLGVKTENGLFCCHSLPSPDELGDFDASIIDRQLKFEDLAIGGHAYNMVWGREQDHEVARRLKSAWEVSVFIMGHQPAPGGYRTMGDSILILACDHDYGVALPVDTWKIQSLESLMDVIIPLAKV